MRRTSSLALVALMALIMTSASAYELATHGVLTQKAYERSILSTDSRVLSDLGIDASNLNVFSEVYYDVSGAEIKERSQNDFEKGKMPNEGKDFLTVKGWLLRGAIREDDYLNADNGQPQDDPYNTGSKLKDNRPLNHFYDPVRNRPLTTFLGIALGKKTPDWATGAANAFNAPNTPDAARRNHFTVFDAREAMYRALTGKKQNGNEIEKSADKAERHKYWATTFRALGDIVHLVEDMAQPQHTRAPYIINFSSTRSPA